MAPPYLYIVKLALHNVIAVSTMNTEYHKPKKTHAASVRVVDTVKKSRKLRIGHAKHGTHIIRRSFLCSRCHCQHVPPPVIPSEERPQTSWIPLPFLNASHLPTDSNPDTPLTQSAGAKDSDNVDTANACAETPEQELQTLTNALDAIADWIDNRPHQYGR